LRESGALHRDSDHTNTKLIRRNDAKVFLREFLRELMQEISATAKVLTLIVVTAVIVVVTYFGFTYFRSQQQVRTLADSQSKKIDQHDSQLVILNERLNQTNQRPATPITPALNIPGTNQLAEARGISAPSHLWTSYSSGVCLIAGSYILTAPKTGRPLRYPEVDQSQEERLLTTGTELPLTYDGNGTVFELEFDGTCFHVGSGFIVTNRHLATEPWLADERGQYFIASSGARPRVHKLLAFFPGQRKPFAMTVKATSPKEDIAICRLQGEEFGIGIPTLPLDQQLRDVAIGEAVVTMGYPTGPNRLLALLPEREAQKVVTKYGGSLSVLLGELATRKLVRPLTTQGHITDLYMKRIMFDAATTRGSSGTPLFGESGKVIGMTFAIFADDDASNFAIGVDSVIELLQAAGWKPKESQ